jgi:transcriptional regulator with XRE-family HTH domain
VSDLGSSAFSQRRLADELVRLRRRVPLTGKEVVTQLGWSEAKLSRIENSQAKVKPSDLEQFMDLYDVSGSHRADLEALAEESHRTDPLEAVGRDLPEGYAKILKAEAEAETIQTWEPQVIPGLLQVEEYTRAVMQLWPVALATPAAAVERRVEGRVFRQRVLTDSYPPELLFVIDESVLARGFAEPSVMRDQMAHLAELSELQNIDLRILPLGGKQVIGTGAFAYFKYRIRHGVPLPDAVAVEHLEGTTFIDSEQDVNTYQIVFNAIRENALNPGASREMLARAVDETWR